MFNDFLQVIITYRNERRPSSWVILQLSLRKMISDSWLCLNFGAITILLRLYISGLAAFHPLLIVRFPNWHVSGCHFQEQVGWGTWLHNSCICWYGRWGWGWRRWWQQFPLHLTTSINTAFQNNSILEISENSKCCEFHIPCWHICICGFSNVLFCFFSEGFLL